MDGTGSFLISYDDNQQSYSRDTKDENEKCSEDGWHWLPDYGENGKFCYSLQH